RRTARGERLVLLEVQDHLAADHVVGRDAGQVLTEPRCGRLVRRLRARFVLEEADRDRARLGLDQVVAAEAVDLRDDRPDLVGSLLQLASELGIAVPAEGGVHSVLLSVGCRTLPPRATNAPSAAAIETPPATAYASSVPPAPASQPAKSPPTEPVPAKP